MSASVVQPVAFFGHGSPLNTIVTNVHTAAWRNFARALPATPRAVVVVSAHWFVPGTRITAARRPATIHDFNSRFPAELFAFDYPAPGDDALVDRLLTLVQPAPAVPDATTWGIDHGAFSVLAHLFPRADVPVVALSLDRTKPPRHHYELARRLAPLRDEGVLIVASGNIVHNLELGDPRPGAPPYDWAERFDARCWDLIGNGDYETLVDYHALGDDARLSIPTPEHYLPLLYTLALARPGERARSITTGIDFRSGSMRSLSFGGADE